MDDMDMREVETAIRKYLIEFDAMSTAINDIVSSCTFTERDVSETSREFNALIPKQATLRSQVNELSTEIETIINHTRDEKLMEKKYKKLRQVQGELLEVKEQLTAMQQKQDHIDGCKHGASEMKDTLAREYKTIMSRLVHARKAFPDLYTRVEQDTGIYFLTPPRKG